MATGRRRPFFLARDAMRVWLRVLGLPVLKLLTYWRFDVKVYLSDRTLFRIQEPQFADAGEVPLIDAARNG
jgi:hypothetical protein